MRIIAKLIRHVNYLPFILIHFYLVSLFATNYVIIWLGLGHPVYFKITLEDYLRSTFGDGNHPAGVSWKTVFQLELFSTLMDDNVKID